MQDGAIALPCPILGVLPEHPSIVETLAYQLNGLIVVFIALGGIWGVMELIGLYFKAADRRKTQPAAPSRTETAAGPNPGTPLESGIVSAEIAAVIAAAVAYTLKGRPHRIEAVSPAVDADWAREGRRQIFASHRVR